MGQTLVHSGADRNARGMNWKTILGEHAGKAAAKAQRQKM